MNNLECINVNQLFEEFEIQRNDNLNDKIKLLNSKNVSYNKETKTLEFQNVEFQEILFQESLLKILNNINIQANIFILFKNCKFNIIKFINFNVIIGQFPASYVDFKDDIRGIEFIWDKEISQISKIVINKSNFCGKFYINKQDDNKTNQLKITRLEIDKVNFEQNFKLHNCLIDEVFIKDVDFQKNADFYKSKFIKGIDENDIYFKSINFKSLALFGDTEFFEKLIFKYVTFEGHNHFKSAKLHKGLDLEYTNVQKEINFYGIEILDKTTTSQETYRIIKNQFEKLNNKIEANKYHALELDQRKKELETDKLNNLSEYLVFKIHDLSSKHSTSWFRTVLCIMIISFFTIFLVHFDIAKDLFFHPSNFRFEYLAKIWSEFWQYINITNLDKLKDKPFILFFNKVSLGYLYYQFITAVRKDTRK